MEISRTSEFCNVNVHRATHSKHMRSEEHLENEKQNEMIILQWFFEEEQASIINKIK